MAKTILVHTPTLSELFMGILHPEAALFKCPFNHEQAIVEHQNFIALLKEQNVTVINVLDVLQGKLFNDSENFSLEKLRHFAKNYITYKNAFEDVNAQARYKEEIISTLPASFLIDIILKKPTITLEKTDINTGFKASYEENPLMNLYFLRDQSITTCKGVVLSNMNSDQRSAEVALIKFVYETLGIIPLHEVSAPGHLEGGDFLPAGEIDFIGQGLRTNEEGIRQLFEKNVFCANQVGVVKDSWFNQDQMHLDTFFNIIAPQKAVLVENRINVNFDDVMSLHLDLYNKTDHGYLKVAENKDFVQFLTDELHYTIIPVSVSDQEKYGINFLTLKANKILAIDGVSQDYKDRLKAENVNATWMDFSNLTCGFGAAHCTTQVIHRERA